MKASQLVSKKQAAKVDSTRAVSRLGLALVFGMVGPMLVAGGGFRPAFAQASVDLTKLRVTAISRDGPPSKPPVMVGLGDTIEFSIDGLMAAIREGFDYQTLILYLDGRPLDDHKPVSIETTGNRLAFMLERTEKSKETWNALVGSPTASTRPITAGIGLTGGRKIPYAEGVDGLIKLEIFKPSWLTGAIVFVLAALLLFIWLARSSNIIRDAGPPDPPKGKQRPYSLGRLQMAWWFFLIFGSYLFIFLLTGDHDTINEQALILIGIATGTAIGSAFIDAGKTNTAVEELAALEPEAARLDAQIGEDQADITALEGKQPRTAEETARLSQLRVQLAERRKQRSAVGQKIDIAEAKKHQPVSESFFLDLLSDKDGIGFHRFQILVWTLVLGFLFCAGVYQSLAMPEFSATLLALMGISSGTYLGFKIPEQQS